MPRPGIPPIVTVASPLSGPVVWAEQRRQPSLVVLPLRSPSNLSSNPAVDEKKNSQFVRIEERKEKKN